MFTYLKLRNFKSFGEITFDLRDKNNKPKNLILIYGENGIGKSNLVSAFYMLSETLHTMNFRDIMQNMLQNSPERFSDEEFINFIKQQFKDIETLIKENKMVDSNENLYMEFGFELKNKIGKYILEMDDEQIVYEKLEYLLIKNKGIYLEISKDKIFLNEKIFKDKMIVSDLNELIEKFWGKHSFFALLKHDISDKVKGYYRGKISPNFMIVLNFLNKVSCKVKFGNRRERGVIGLPKNYLKNYDSGKIAIEDVQKLDKTECMLNDFFTLSYKDIKKVYYKRKKKNKEISYKLCVRKKVYGVLRDIDFELESTGTQSVLQLLPYMLIAVEGAIAVVDEFDTGIHELLVKSLVKSLNGDINGQLIMTTHNTLLMEAELSKDSIYVINENDEGQKEVECILKYDNKINDKTNIRKQYIHGKYNGIPNEVHIDFKKLTEIIKS